MVVMLSGCLSIDMKVGKNGSLDITYTIDTSQTGGMVEFKDIKKAIEESVDSINDTADSKIAKLKSVKENKSKKTITAVIEVKDINKMNDGSFFGTVKEYRKESGIGLDNLVDTKDKSVDKKKISDNLHMVYFPMIGADQYSLMEITVTVPGSIKYITDGGEITKKSTALFGNQYPLVVFKKGGGFPFWLLIIAAVAVFLILSGKKKPSAAPAAPVVDAPVQPPVQAGPVEPTVQAGPIEPQPPVPDDTNNNPAE
jgi:hypothetical protein